MKENDNGEFCPCVLAVMVSHSLVNIWGLIWRYIFQLGEGFTFEYIDRIVYNIINLDLLFYVFIFY